MNNGRPTEFLGKRVRDRISGFTGIATAHSFFLNGCERVSLDPPVDKDGKMQDGVWFDVQQLEIVHDAPEETTGFVVSATGGPRKDATRRSDAPE